MEQEEKEGQLQFQARALLRHHLSFLPPSSLSLWTDPCFDCFTYIIGSFELRIVGLSESERERENELKSASGELWFLTTLHGPRKKFKEGVPNGSLPPTLHLPTFPSQKMTSRASEIKNIWIAAGDGDVERVKVSFEDEKAAVEESWKS